MPDPIAKVGRPADHRTTLDQIGQGVLMNLGARDYVHDDPHGMVMFRIGPSRVVRKAIIVLNGLDLYDVEIGRMHRRTFEWTTETTWTNVHAADLGKALIRLHDQVSTR